MADHGSSTFDVDVNGHNSTNACKESICSSNEVTPKRAKNARDDVDGDHKRPTRDEEMFDEIFGVLSGLTVDGLNNSETGNSFAWFKRVNEYNVPHGKKNRGLTVVHSFRYLAGDTATAEQIKCAAVIGWCVEWLQAFFLVADDVMDSSITRRGQLCWYKVTGVGLTAINDSFFLENAVYALLRHYLRPLPCYVDIVDLFHQTTMQTIVGQNLDMTTAPTDRVDFTDFTIDRYNAIVKYKTAYYSFYLPVAAAMYLAGISDELSHSRAKAILLKMGEFFQIQDDYLDCYGDPAVTGKIGTDIEDNKCSWLVVQALSRADKKQLETLQNNYGCHDAVKVAAVKAVYAELSLIDVYAAYEESSYMELMSLIDGLDVTLPRDMFVAYAAKIYKRQK